MLERKQKNGFQFETHRSVNVYDWLLFILKLLQTVRGLFFDSHCLSVCREEYNISLDGKSVRYLVSVPVNCWQLFSK